MLSLETEIGVSCVIKVNRVINVCMLYTCVHEHNIDLMCEQGKQVVIVVVKQNNNIIFISLFIIVATCFGHS
jgi:hypothetical protein